MVGFVGCPAQGQELDSMIPIGPEVLSQSLLRPPADGGNNAVSWVVGFFLFAVAVGGKD